MKRGNFVGMVFITGVLSIITMGCFAPPIVFDPTMMPHFDKPILSRIVLADATYEKNVIRENYKPFFAKIERSLRKDIGKTNLMSDLVFERDMPQKGYDIVHTFILPFAARNRFGIDYVQLPASEHL